MVSWIYLPFLASTCGALTIFITNKFKEKTMSLLYGSSAGIMLAACFLTLLLPGINHKDLTSTLFFLLGTLLMSSLDHLVPHESALTHEIEGPGLSLPKYTRLILTIALHNIPQGLALGISLTNQNAQTTLILVVGLCLQNIPEGMATAIPLLQYFPKKLQVFLMAEALSFLEIPCCLLGFHLAAQINIFLDALLGFAAGILLYTIIEEIIPDAWSHQNRSLATLALFLGFTVMLVLYISL